MATAEATTKPIPPIEGIKVLWIFLPPGTSPILAFLSEWIKIGVIKNPTENEVSVARIKNILKLVYTLANLITSLTIALPLVNN